MDMTSRRFDSISCRLAASSPGVLPPRQLPLLSPAQQRPAADLAAVELQRIVDRAYLVAIVELLGQLQERDRRDRGHEDELLHQASLSQATGRPIQRRITPVT
jgi:hypothetical protein